MKFSMMSYMMTRQKEHFDFQRMLDLTTELDLAGIDLLDDLGLPPEELRKRLDDAGIPAVGYIFGPGHLSHESKSERRKAVDKLREKLDEAVVLGAPVVMLVPVPIEDHMDRNVSRTNYIKGLSLLAPYAEEAGLTLTVENFPGVSSGFVTADDFLAAVREVPSLRLTYDNGNAGTGEDPVESFRRTAEYAVHAHFKDWEVSDRPVKGFHIEGLDGRYYRPALIGEGVVDHAGCLRAMKEAGYDGCINIEYEGNKYPPEEAVRRAVSYLRSLER